MQGLSTLRHSEYAEAIDPAAGLIRLIIHGGQVNKT